RIAILTLIAGIACLSVGPIPASLGQGQDHKRLVDRKSVRVFGSGGANRTLGGRKSPAPAPLDESFKIEIARQAGSTLGSPLLKLTRKAPSVANRGALVFENPALVEGGEDIIQSLLFFPAPVSRAQDDPTEAEIKQAQEATNRVLKLLEETGDFSRVIDEM